MTDPESGFPRRRIVRSRDGAEIAYWESGSGPSLILVHGTTADHTRWNPVLPELEARFTVCAVDRRGAGASAGETQPYALLREFEDIAAVIEAIHAEAGEAPSLLGHSHGAICSLEAALLTPHLRRLILYEPPLPAEPDIVARLEKLLDKGKRGEVVSTFMREIARMPEERLRAIQSLPSWEGRAAVAHAIVRELKGQRSHPLRPEKFRAMKLPTLLLLGGASAAPFKATIDLLHQALPASEIAVLVGQQHAAMDTGKEIFLKPVLEFLAR
jgi:pimeloyl-ACP methyl ester carboxylesterase